MQLITIQYKKDQSNFFVREATPFKEAYHEV